MREEGFKQSDRNGFPARPAGLENPVYPRSKSAFLLTPGEACHVLFAEVESYKHIRRVQPRLR